MRTLRGAFIGAIALVLISTTFVGPAVAAADAPTAPYTALTVNFSGWGSDGNFSYEPSRNTLAVYQQTPGYALAMSGSTASHWHNINISPAIGDKFAAGTTYPVVGAFTPLADSATLNISGDGQGCVGVMSGSLSVTQATYAPATALLTAFAASYSITCGTQKATGDIRFQSDQPYQAPDSWDYEMPFGSQPVGITGTPQKATVTVDGTQSTAFGAASISGADVSAFTITANTCSGQTLSYGSTCSIEVTPKATALTGQVAILSLADNGIGGSINRRLTLTGYDPRNATVSGSMDFGWIPAYDTSAPQTVTVTGSAQLPITFGTGSIMGGAASDFTATADTCSGVTLAAGQKCSVTVVAHPTTSSVFQQAVFNLPDNSAAGTTQISLNVDGYAGDRGTFHPLAPSRILDTRSGNGATKAKLGAGGIIHLQITSRGGVPSANVSAVVLNVTVTGASTTSYLSAYPTGAKRPTVSSLNYVSAKTVANSVTVSVGTGGKVDLYNSAGSTNVIADVSGYYSSESPPNSGASLGGQYHAVTPVRLVDTRTWDAKSRPVPSNYFINVLAGFGSAINPHIRAFAVNVTAVGPTGTGYLTAWNGAGDSLPNASTLNFVAHQTVPNFAIVPTIRWASNDAYNGWPSIGVYTNKTTDIIVDIVGYYDDSTLADGLRFSPIVPVRITDTRVRQGWPSAIGSGATATIKASSVTAPTTEALAMNVTAVHPTASTYLSVWAAGITGVGKPNVSNLNPGAGVTQPNAVQTLVGPTDSFNIYNNKGSVNVLVDVVGTFYLYPGTASGSTGTTQGLKAQAIRGSAVISTATALQGSRPIR